MSEFNRRRLMQACVGTLGITAFSDDVVGRDSGNKNDGMITIMNHSKKDFSIGINTYDQSETLVDSQTRLFQGLNGAGKSPDKSMSIQRLNKLSRGLYKVEITANGQIVGSQQVLVRNGGMISGRELAVLISPGGSIDVMLSTD